MSDLRVVFATPCYDGKVHTGYLESMIRTVTELERRGISHTHLIVNGICHVEHARNLLAQRFLDTLGTHLFFIDSDLSWQADAVYRMLNRDLDIIVGLYPLKQAAEEYPADFSVSGERRLVGIIGRDGQSLPRLIFAPTGFMCIRRNVLCRMIAAYPETKFREQTVTGETVDLHCLFSCECEDGVWYGEDVYFCKRWRAIGGEIYLEPNIDFTHCGTRHFWGNWHKFALRQMAAAPRTMPAAAE